MSAHDHGRFEDDVAPYVLGALPELEAQRFESHLRGCELCQQEAARLRPAVEALPRSVAQMAPPPSLKENVMETVRAEAGAGAEPRRTTRWSWPRLRVPVLAGAAALLAGLVIGVGLGTLGDSEQSPRTVAAQVDRERLPGAKGSLVVADGSGGAVLRLSQLPQAEPGKVYEVWISAGGRVRPGALFEPHTDGTAVAGIDADLEEADAVLVTRERRGGVANPTEDPVISIPL